MAKAEVFIIESLGWCDEKKEERLEGRLLRQVLLLSGKKPLYYYIRTKQELEDVLNRFEDSDYRYLHLSCHGNSRGIATTLDHIDHQELGRILNPYLEGRRLFISACEAVNRQFVNAVAKGSGCYSIAGPKDDVLFSSAAIFWGAFYHKAFEMDRRKMTGTNIRPILGNLANLFEVSIRYYGKDENDDNRYIPKTLGPTKEGRDGAGKRGK